MTTLAGWICFSPSRSTYSSPVAFLPEASVSTRVTVLQARTSAPAVCRAVAEAETLVPPTLPANGAFMYKGSNLKFVSITDVLSNTIFIGEKHIPINGFGNPPDSSIYNGASHRQAGVGQPIAKGPTGSGGFGSWHPGVCQFLMGDGTVRVIPVTIDLTLLGHLANRMDGNTVSLDF